jgi:hydroxylamine oxidation protein HaoB
VYWLACLDDLARLSEIEALGGAKLPFEARVFPAADNIHGQIAEARRWAGEAGPGAYLAQQLPGGGARVWRITREAGTKTLLARLLPFTSSLAQPLAKLSLVYQSSWGGYLSVYQWQR